SRQSYRPLSNVTVSERPFKHECSPADARHDWRVLIGWPCLMSMVSNTSNDQGSSSSVSQRGELSREGPFAADGVPWRRCGGSELRLPLLGLGCWAYGGGEYWGPQSQQDVDAVV